MRGAALSGLAAEAREGGSGINSRTIASLEHAWGHGRDQLTKRDVLVIDEAGMVGSRQMERVLSNAAEAGAKVVLVGNPEQPQAIEPRRELRCPSRARSRLIYYGIYDLAANQGWKTCPLVKPERVVSSNGGALPRCVTTPATGL